MGLLDPCSDLVVDFVESAPQGAGELGEIGEDSAQAGAQDTVIDSGEEQGDAQAEVGEPVTVCAGDALDDLVQSEAAEMIGHLPGGQSAGGLAEQGGEALAQMAVGESARELRKSQQSMAQRLDLGIGEAQRRSPLLVHLAGTMQLLEALLRQQAVMADFLDLE